MAGTCVALIGGGRWARVHASVLARMSVRVERVLWVTRHNRAALDTFLEQNGLEQNGLERNSGAAPAFDVFASLDAAIAEGPDAAIVVTAASDHASTVETLLRNAVPTLVEKPLALSSRSAKVLIELADRHDVALCVALHLLKADFLQHFREMWAGRRVANIHVEWLDPASETRHGETKSCNFAAHKVDETVPHLWSLLTMMQPGHEPHLRAVWPLPLGAVALECDIGPSRATARLARRAPARKRKVEIAFADGGSATLDFTTEPGRFIIDGVDRQAALPADRLGPLAAEIHGFLDVVDRTQDSSTYPQLSRRCLGSVLLAEAVRERLEDEEAKAVAARLAAGVPVADADLSAWIIDNLAPALGAKEIHIAAADHVTHTRIIEAAQQAIDGRTSGGRDAEASDAVEMIVRDSRFLQLVAKYRTRRQKTVEEPAEELLPHRLRSDWAPPH